MRAGYVAIGSGDVNSGTGGRELLRKANRGDGWVRAVFLYAVTLVEGRPSWRPRGNVS